MEEFFQKTISADWWMLLALLALALILIFGVGRFRLGGFLISIYLAFAITVKSDFSPLDSPGTRTAYFLVVGLIIFSLFRSSFQITTEGGKIETWLKSVLLSLSIVGLLNSVVLSWYPQKVLKGIFSDFSLNIFTSDLAQIFWIVIPLVLLMLFKQRD